MEEIGQQLSHRVNTVNDFDVTFDQVKKEREKGGQLQELTAYGTIDGKSSSQLKQHSLEH